MTTMAARDAGASMWERTDLKPTDVDTAQLYDGFSVLTIAWLEALGFCGRGESGPFIEGGANIARDGLLPLNTAGGQLSGGRLHGFGLIHEACVQLRGEGGPRQVVRPGGRAGSGGRGQRRRAHRRHHVVDPRRQITLRSALQATLRLRSCRRIGGGATLIDHDLLVTRPGAQGTVVTGRPPQCERPAHSQNQSGAQRVADPGTRASAAASAAWK